MAVPAARREAGRHSMRSCASFASSPTMRRSSSNRARQSRSSARRREIGYVDRLTDDPADALRSAREAATAGSPLSIALVGNAAEIESGWARAGERFDVVTDQTSAHDALAGYVPSEISLGDALA